MKRIALLAAAVLGTGCVATVESSGDVAIYWDFLRHTTAAPGYVYYDTSFTPGGPDGACSQAGVDYVQVTDLNGNLLDPMTPWVHCVYQGVQGARFSNFSPGPYTFVVHAFAGSYPTGTEVYTGQGSVDVSGGVVNSVDVTAQGVQGNLVVTATLFDGVTTYTTCGAAGVQWFDFWIEDHVGTVIDSGSAACASNQTPGVTVGATDLDVLYLWINAVRTTTVPEQIIFTTCQYPISFHASGNFTVPLDYAATCTPAHP